MRKIILCLLFICLFPIKVSASSGYKEITGGTIEVTLHLVDTDKHERSIFDNSHFVLDIQGEEDSEFETGEGSVFQKFNVTISVKRAIPNMTYNLGEEHQLVTDSRGNGTATLPLGHNQMVCITDLPIGSSYTVSEDEEDYI